MLRFIQTLNLIRILMHIQMVIFLIKLPVLVSTLKSLQSKLSRTNMLSNTTTNK